MQQFLKLRAFVRAGVLALVLAATGGAAVQACDTAACCHSEYVVCYVARQVAYTKCITLYDSCGQPYEVTKICYRTVHVPVKKKVRVCE